MADTSFGGLADSLAQAFMFDKPLLEARRVRQLARVTATGAREQARLAKDAARQRAKQARADRQSAQEGLKAMRAETATVKSKASQERLVVTEQARAEAQRVRQERSRKEKEMQRLLQMRVATRQEGAQRQTAREGQRKDTAETRRGVAQSVNEKMLLDAAADPSRVVTKDGAPIQAAAKLNPESESAQLGGVLPSCTQAGILLATTVVGLFAGAYWMDMRNGNA